MKYIYGPIRSRRLGWSLGISLTPYKVCNFDCIYCQLGPTFQKTNSRDEYVKSDLVIKELKDWLRSDAGKKFKIDYLTFSGTGEPTLHKGIGWIIHEIKKFSSIPIAILTNASLVGDPQLRQEILEADLLVPSLDAVIPEIFEKIDRPFCGIEVSDIINGLILLREEFTGKIWLEVMLVKGINDDLEHIRALKSVIDKIRPDKVQLNSPVRSPAESQVVGLESGALEKIKEILGDGCEIV